MRDVHFMELNKELFHAGTNFGVKLPAKGLTIKYDSEEGWFEAKHPNGRIGYILPNNVAFFELVTETPIPVIVNEHKTEDKSKRSKAQVATPQSHVFEGRGHGAR